MWRIVNSNLGHQGYITFAVLKTSAGNLLKFVTLQKLCFYANWSISNPKLHKLCKAPIVVWTRFEFVFYFSRKTINTSFARLYYQISACNAAPLLICSFPWLFCFFSPTPKKEAKSRRIRWSRVRIKKFSK